MKKPIIALTFLIMLVARFALAGGYPWRDHAPPFDFLFGNHIDTHQQSKLSGNQLNGFFYIYYYSRKTSFDILPRM